MEETAVLEVPVVEKKKRGRKPKQVVDYVADGKLISDIVDFDNFADKKAKEKEPKVTIDNVDFRRYTDLGGRYYEKTNCVIFGNAEMELVVYQNGVVILTDFPLGSNKFPCSSRTFEQVVSLVKGFGLTG